MSSWSYSDASARVDPDEIAPARSIRRQVPGGLQELVRPVGGTTGVERPVVVGALVVAHARQVRVVVLGVDAASGCGATGNGRGRAALRCGRLRRGRGRRCCCRGGRGGRGGRRSCLRLPLCFELLVDRDLSTVLRLDELGVDDLLLLTKLIRGGRLLLAPASRSRTSPDSSSWERRKAGRRRRRAH